MEKEPQPHTAREAGSGDLEQTTSAAGYDPGGGPRQTGHAGRFWSVRRLPAGIVALLALAAAGLMLYDLISVRAGRSAMSWRRALADEMATTPVDDPKVLAAACVVALLGVWLIVLAVTPGRRGLLPMRQSAGVRAGLERTAAALVLRDRAMQVSGVQSVRVAVGRRKVRARARAHFRDLHDVRGDLDSALGSGIRQLGLARQPGLSVHVERPKKR
ncbi:DUF6286 domain-containing protein [Streptomyces sp. M600PL45_2]|uniref:DUF6286 domain-containing protein n=1 Tax=Streptomyces marispadix TaxID=2922868 RepID=A0ABS9STH1_9ACTN|nr:DUF6286 domain-containing protein [Streptomyces marispadix]MCH6159573.1 DUF6286 domain-containing protein [Streptomyces marispadix]